MDGEVLEVLACESISGSERWSSRGVGIEVPVEA
jgi:hypothetical protein